MLNPVGAENGESLEKHFYPEFNIQDLINHGKHHLCLTLAIDGKKEEVEEVGSQKIGILVLL